MVDAASDEARAHWKQLGARVYGASRASGALAEGKGKDVDFTKVMNDGGSSGIRFSLLHCFRFDKWLWMRIGEALHPGPKVPHRSSKQVGLTKGDVRRLVKSMVMGVGGAVLWAGCWTSSRGGPGGPGSQGQGQGCGGFA